MPKNTPTESPELEIAELAQSFSGPDVEEVQQDTIAEAASVDHEQLHILNQIAEFRVANATDFVLIVGVEPGDYLMPRERNFVEAFCRDDLIVPKDGKNAEPEVAKRTYDYVPMSPQLFPDTFIKHFVNANISEPKNTEAGMNQRRLHFRELRAIFKSLQPMVDEDLDPLKNDSGRISVVPRKDGKLLNHAFQDPWPRGAIVVSNNPRRKEGPKRHFSLYTNFYDFLRSLKHTLNNYTGRYNIKDLDKRPEFEVLNHLRADIRGSIDALQGWKNLSGKQKIERAKIIQDLEELLTGVQDEYKIKSKDHLKDAKSLRERKSRKFNPGCTCAKLVGGFNDLMSRFENCVGIERSVGGSLGKLEWTQKEIEKKFEDIEVRIEDILKSSYFNFSRFVLNPKNQIEALRWAEVAEGNFDFIFEEVNALVENDSLPAPFPQWAMALRQNLEAAQIIFKRLGEIEIDEAKQMVPVDVEDVYDAGVESVVRANLTVRCINVQKGLAGIINEILTRPWDLDPNKAYEMIDELHKKLDAHAFRKQFPHRDEESAKLVFKIDEVDALSNYCRTLKNMLKKWKVQQIKLGDRQTWYQSKYQDVPTEEYLEELSAVEDRKIDLDVAHLNELYEAVKAFDFNAVFEALEHEVEKDGSYNKRTTIAHRTLESYHLYTKDDNPPIAGE